MKLSRAAAEARRAYLRQWRQENPEKIKEHQRRFWERKAKEHKEEGGGSNG